MTIHGATIFSAFKARYIASHGDEAGLMDAWTTRIVPRLPGSGPLYAMTGQQYADLLALAGAA